MCLGGTLALNEFVRKTQLGIIFLATCLKINFQLLIET